MRYYEVKFNINPDTPVARDIVAALAGEAGFESFDDSGEVLCGYVKTEDFDRTALDKSLSEFPIEGVSVTYSLAETSDEDWNATWEDNGFEPIIIADKCVIYNAKDADRINAAPSMPSLRIAIDAKQAFGTGTHETTQMMVENLMVTEIKGKSVLDCGCGTGILGIAAKKLGAAHVVGYDIDDWSVRNAMHNAEINGVEMEVLEGDKRVLSHVCGVFDIVLANINRNILLADMPDMRDIMGADTTLIISGFYEEDIPQLLEKAQELKLTEVGRRTKGQWASLMLKA
ncbi:50S ribosomal protein L11 methyltransferase [uncultured Prevotella sp.]|uniref:50S ribosomal protein L11 methyltransferase n=1 Tax=uncultured Prevotella sp. TaxID=159272 RepID=UPI0025916633|nr:50S ribosomal protein L11 methyltransferase [uncultured Prevotella sp.]